MNRSGALDSYPTRNWRGATGAAIWLAFLCLAWPGGAPALLLLAAFVAFPVGFHLIEALEPSVATSWAWSAVRWLQLPCALVLPLAFMREPGLSAAVLTVPWLMVTGLMFLIGAAPPRLQRASPGVTAALVFPVVGGAWLLLSRLGMRPLDLTPEIVQATALHFHYAGFALPLIAAAAARRSPGRSGTATVIGVIAGVPLVAIGITLTALGFRYFEAPAAWFLAAACGLLAWRQVREANKVGRGPAVLLAASSLSLLAAMLLAVLYALGNLIGSKWLDVPQMVWTHGVLNAVGFSMLGIAGWNMLLTAERGT